MNLKEYQAAFALANSEESTAGEDLSIFDGYGLRDFKPVVATIRQVAALMRWQAWDLYQGWQSDELTTIRNIFRHKVEIAG